MYFVGPRSINKLSCLVFPSSFLKLRNRGQLRQRMALRISNLAPVECFTRNTTGCGYLLLNQSRENKTRVKNQLDKIRINRIRLLFHICSVNSYNFKKENIFTRINK